MRKMRIDARWIGLALALLSAAHGFGAAQPENAAANRGQGYAAEGRGYGRAAGSPGVVGGARGGRPGYNDSAQPPQSFRAAELAALDSIPKGALSGEEIATLLYRWQEEKLARDLYSEFALRYGVPLFGNIARSEQTHMDLLALVLERYQLELPGPETAGAFHNPDTAAAYARLIEEGGSSLAEAVRVGIEIEQSNIRDLEKAAAATDNEDVRYVLERLLLGSRNHLTALQRQNSR